MPDLSFPPPSMFPPPSYDAWNTLPPLGAFDTLMSFHGSGRCDSPALHAAKAHCSRSSHLSSSVPSNMFDLGLDMGASFSQAMATAPPDMPRRPLYAPQPDHASAQSTAASGGNHVPLFARRSQPAELPSPQVALPHAAQQLHSSANQQPRQDHVAAAPPAAAAVPPPAKGPAMLLKLLSSGSGSLGASPLSGLNANPTYTQVPLLQLHAHHTTFAPCAVT